MKHFSFLEYAHFINPLQYIELFKIGREFYFNNVFVDEKCFSVELLFKYWKSYLRLSFFVLMGYGNRFWGHPFEQETSYGLVASAASDMKSGITIGVDNINITIFIQKHFWK